MPDKTFQTISASQAAGMFGISPYCTRRMLYDFLHDGTVIEETENESMEWGKVVQPFILQRAARKLNLEVVENPDEYVRHPTLPIGATIDAHLACPSRGYGVVEAKALRWQIHKEAWTMKSAPPHIEIQVQQQMMIPHPKYGLPKWGVIAVMIGANEDFILYPRAPSPTIQAEIIKEAQRLVEDVAGHRRPNVFGEAAEMKFIEHLYPAIEPNKKLVDMDDVALGQLMVDYFTAKTQKTFFEKNEKALKVKILDRTGPNAAARVYGAEAKITRSDVDAGVVSLPGPMKAQLMHAAEALRPLATSEEVINALAAMSSAILWEEITRKAHLRTELTVIPHPEDPEPAKVPGFDFGA